MLEPRLQEYLKKRKHYRDNGIEPCVSFEKEFRITHHDKRVLKAYLTGDKVKCQLLSEQPSTSLKSSTKSTKQYFPSKTFRDSDARVPKLNKHSFEKPVNRGMFHPDKGGSFYEDKDDINTDVIMDARDFKSNSNLGFDMNNTRFDPRSDPKMFTGPEYYSRHSSQYRVDKDPRNRNIISNMYKNDDFTGKYCAFSTLLTDNITNTTNINKKSNKKKLSKADKTYNYMMNNDICKGSDAIDTDFETTLQRGMPSHTTKSYGYRNPDEHYYHFINSQFHNPELIESWVRGGDSTRRSNKSIARQRYTREI